MYKEKRDNSLPDVDSAFMSDKNIAQEPAGPVKDSAVKGGKGAGLPGTSSAEMELAQQAPSAMGRGAPSPQ